MSTEKPKATLSKKSIAAIADEMETRLNKTRRVVSVGAESPHTGNIGNAGNNGRKLFFWGAASGVAVALAVPLFGKQARPAVRGAIKGGILAGRYAKRFTMGIKEDVQDLTAEAKADLDAEHKRPGENGIAH